MGAVARELAARAGAVEGDHHPPSVDLGRGSATGCWWGTASRGGRSGAARGRRRGSRRGGPRGPCRPSLATTTHPLVDRGAGWCPRWPCGSGRRRAGSGRRATGPPARAGWNLKNRLALTKPTCHRSSMRTRCGSQTPTDRSPSVGSRSGRVSRTCRPVSRSASDSASVTATDASRRFRPVCPSKSPQVLVATSHRAAVADQVRGVVAVHARPARAPEEQVGAVLGQPAVGVQRPDARVRGVEEAGAGGGRGEQQPPRRRARACRRPRSRAGRRAGRADRTRPRGRRRPRPVGVEVQRAAEAPRRGCRRARSGRTVARARQRPRSRVEPGQVRAGQGERQRVGRPSSRPKRRLRWCVVRPPASTCRSSTSSCSRTLIVVAAAGEA